MLYYIGTTTVSRKFDNMYHDDERIYPSEPKGAWGVVDIPEGAEVIDVRSVRIGSNPAGKHTVTWIREI